MAAAMNGIALHGGFIPYGGTFLTFADYSRPAIRLAALMGIRVIHVMTHDSIGLGEDGPTHQPVEHLASLRAIPNLLVFRPGDAVETAEAWDCALRAQTSPSLLCLSRQAMPTFRDAGGVVNLVALGAYVIVEPEGGRDVTLIATGSEVSIALQAAKLLASDDVRAAVVSAPCFDLFRQQSREYRAEVLGSVPRIGVEAAVEGDWARWLGDSGEFVGMTGFGASAPAEVLYREFGITAEAVAAAAETLPGAIEGGGNPFMTVHGKLRGTAMARITLRQLLDHAAEHGYGVPAFNINNMEQGLAIMEAAAAVDAPVIIQASRGARSYANDIMLSKMIDALEEMYPQIPLCMHQDHGNEEATCATAIKHGFTSVMMDGSLKADAKTAADYDYNVDITRRVVEMAHWIGASVEGELGVLGSLEHGGGEQEDGHGVEGKVSHDQLLTDPDQAVDFVRATKVDALAIAMGTSHGAYKFSRKPDGDILAMQVVEEIHRRLPNTHLVMHGSSSVPQPLQDMFNQFGGEMPQTWGVPVEEIVRGIKHGVRKVNIDTDCRLAMTAAFRKVATQTKSEFDPRKFLKPAMDAMRDLCRERFEQFGTAGNASKIKVVPLSEMAKRYRAGSLDPRIGGHGRRRRITERSRDRTCRST